MPKANTKSSISIPSTPREPKELAVSRTASPESSTTREARTLSFLRDSGPFVLARSSTTLAPPVFGLGQCDILASQAAAQWSFPEQSSGRRLLHLKVTVTESSLRFQCFPLGQTQEDIGHALIVSCLAGDNPASRFITLTDAKNILAHACGLTNLSQEEDGRLRRNVVTGAAGHIVSAQHQPELWGRIRGYTSFKPIAKHNSKGIAVLSWGSLASVLDATIKNFYRIKRKSEVYISAPQIARSPERRKSTGSSQASAITTPTIMAEELPELIMDPSPWSSSEETPILPDEFLASWFPELIMDPSPLGSSEEISGLPDELLASCFPATSLPYDQLSNPQYFPGIPPYLMEYNPSECPTGTLGLFGLGLFDMEPFPLNATPDDELGLANPPDEFADLPALISSREGGLPDEFAGLPALIPS